jgi:uncharacterized protein (DUF1501 family)
MRTSDIQSHRKNAKDSDQPFAALIKDLKARGLLDETIIVCGSEFGRTPVVELGGAGTHAGRDHNPHGFSMWLAGGGIKGGMTYGATDDFGWKVVDKPVHVHDIHATILYSWASTTPSSPSAPAAATSASPTSPAT